MNITELELRELTSLRDKLRHRLRVQLVESENSTETDDDQKVMRNKISTFRESVGEAYRQRDLYRMRAYFNAPAADVLEYSYRRYIDLVFAALHEVDAVDAMNSFNDEHIEAYKRIVNVLAKADHSRFQYDGVKQRSAVAFVLSHLEHEQIIMSIVRDRDTLDLDYISELLSEMKQGAISLHEGVL